MFLNVRARIAAGVEGGRQVFSRRGVGVLTGEVEMLKTTRARFIRRFTGACAAGRGRQRGRVGNEGLRGSAKFKHRFKQS
jgi:hypothetical protein